MRVLFARIGYMKFYQGPQKGDEKPIGGGSYNEKNIGHEAFNFKEINGNVSGYFQPYVKKPFENIHISLKRIDPQCAEDEINDVLVIFFAKNPISGGQVIIGWYKKAKVYSFFQDSSKEKERNKFSYNIKANINETVLLPIRNRKYPLGHGIKGHKGGNPGQANAFYLYDEKLKKKQTNKYNAWIYDAIDYVLNYNGQTISSFDDEVSEEIHTSLFSGSGQGFQSDVEKRLAIEEYAMDLCKQHYSKQKYSVKDVSKNKPYDFHVKKGDEELLIETKGTQTNASKIILTKNEVKLSQEKGDDMSLFIVHSIEFNKKSVKKGSGKIKIVQPWKINKKRLIPISYIYQIE